MTQIKRFLPTVACLLLALVFTGAASNEELLRCSRDDDRCNWSNLSLFVSRERSFPVSTVREVRFVAGTGKNKRGQTLLVFVSGDELGVASDTHDTAHQRHVAIYDFFAGNGATLEQRSHGSPWLYAIAAMLAGGAVTTAVSALRKPRAARPSPVVVAPEETKRQRRMYALLGGLVALSVVANLVYMAVAQKKQGTLEVVCRSRCRFLRSECLPGGEVTMSLDPGSYTVEVWTGARSPWAERTVQVRLGEVTRFVCAP